MSRSITSPSGRISYNLNMYLSFFYFIRIMVEHDRKLKGLEDHGISCAGKFVGDEDSVQFEHGGDSHRADLIDKTKFDDRRAILNSNTLLKNVLKKDKNLAKEIGEMNKHMEVRFGSFCFI